MALQIVIIQLYYAIYPNFFREILFFYKEKFEYVIPLIGSLFFVITCDIWLYKYYKVKETYELNNNMIFFAKIINGLLVKDLQSAYHIGNSAEHLFCTQDNKNSNHPGIKRIFIASKPIFCNTRLIKERLDSVLPTYINYKVSIDKTILVSSNYSFTKIFSIINDNVLDDYILKTEVSIDHYSSYFSSLKDKTITIIYFIITCSAITWILFICSMFFFIYKFKKCIKHNTILTIALKKLDLIKLADTKSKDFTNKFYKYSKTIHNFSKLDSGGDDSAFKELYHTAEYLPIPLLDIDLIRHKRLFKIQLDDTVNELKHMIDSYAALNSYDIIFTYDSRVNHIIMPFDQILFDQIMISLMANIIYFAKDKRNTRHISLVINDQAIIFIHDAFNLNQQMMIEYCQRIFYETKNPYIINFGQIFIILNKIYNLKFDVYSVNQENILKIHFHKKDTNESNILFFNRSNNE